jgi:hypothetical protein
MTARLRVLSPDRGAGPLRSQPKRVRGSRFEPGDDHHFVRCSYRAARRRSDDVAVTAIAATLAFLSSITLLAFSVVAQCFSSLH